jgi:hypothetical protein
MYYLVIVNLGVEKCIDKNKYDIYSDGYPCDCTQDLGRWGKKMVKNVTIDCINPPTASIQAIVYRD